MMYNSKLAVAIKSNGQVLRENGETVYIPFGSEYSVFIKNLNTVRALVTVEIDGDDVGGGTQFVIDGNSSIDIERFIKNGNLYEGNRFKFIERTSTVENHRGVGIEDGIVRVEFQFEKIYVRPVIDHVYPYGGRRWSDNDPMRKGIIRDFDITYDTYSGSIPCSNNASFTSSQVKGAAATGNVTLDSFNVNDAGITAPGSVSDQQFHTVASFPVESTVHSIVLKILGQTEQNVLVRKPITVKTKPVCTSCGARNKATAKFCTECGTGLVLV